MIAATLNSSLEPAGESWSMSGANLLAASQIVPATGLVSNPSMPVYGFGRIRLRQTHVKTGQGIRLEISRCLPLQGGLNDKGSLWVTLNVL